MTFLILSRQTSNYVMSQNRKTLKLFGSISLIFEEILWGLYYIKDHAWYRGNMLKWNKTYTSLTKGGRGEKKGISKVRWVFHYFIMALGFSNYKVIIIWKNYNSRLLATSGTHALTNTYTNSVFTVLKHEQMWLCLIISFLGLSQQINTNLMTENKFILLLF